MPPYYLRFDIPDSVQSSLRVADGEQELHLTLCFLSRDPLTPKQEDAVHDTCFRVCDLLPAPSATVTHLGYFPRRGESKGVWWRAVESDPLRALRDFLVRELQKLCVPVDTCYPVWKPHITIKHGGVITLEEVDAMVTTEVRFSHLTYRADRDRTSWSMRL